MKKTKDKFLIPFCLLLFAACSNSEVIQKFPELEDKYDPSRPKQVVSMSPLVGRVDNNFVLEGNFGNGTYLDNMKLFDIWYEYNLYGVNYRVEGYLYRVPETEIEQENIDDWIDEQLRLKEEQEEG